MLNQSHFFHSQPATLPKDPPAKFYLSMTLGLSFMITLVAPTGSSIFYQYLVTKIGNRNLRGGICGAFDIKSNHFRAVIPKTLKVMKNWIRRRSNAKN